jgi:hypothetical protein
MARAYSGALAARSGASAGTGTLERSAGAVVWRPVGVVLAVDGPEAFCSTRRWLATFERVTGRPLVEIEFGAALPPPDEAGFADVRRLLRSRMARG